MNDHAAFLGAICAEPQSDELRLVYADFLDENGDPERAEFIRVGCELAENRKAWPGGAVPWRHLARREVLQQRQRELLDAGPQGSIHCANRVCWTGWPFMVALAMDPITRRGFVSEVRCLCDAWLQHAGTVVANQPIERVVLVDKEPTRTYHEDDPSHQVWVWWRHGEGAPGVSLPPPLWEALVPKNRGYIVPWERITVSDFDTRGDALDALSTAALAFGHQQAKSLVPA